MAGVALVDAEGVAVGSEDEGHSADWGFKGLPVESHARLMGFYSEPVSRLR